MSHKSDDRAWGWEAYLGFENDGTESVAVFCPGCVAELAASSLRAITSTSMPPREITVQTASQTFVLGNDSALDLLAHIREAGGENRDDAERPLLEAINSQGAHDVRWSENGKRGALHGINAWVLSEGAAATGDTVEELRYELMRDLRLPPFDEEVPYDPT